MSTAMWQRLKPRPGNLRIWQAGLLLALLAAAEAWLAREHPQAPALVAHVLGDNTASHQLFERAGYARATTCYSKELPPWNPQTASA